MKVQDIPVSGSPLSHVERINVHTLEHTHFSKVEVIHLMIFISVY